MFKLVKKAMLAQNIFTVVILLPLHPTFDVVCNKDQQNKLYFLKSKLNTSFMKSITPDHIHI